MSLKELDHVSDHVQYVYEQEMRGRRAEPFQHWNFQKEKAKNKLSY